MELDNQDPQNAQQGAQNSGYSMLERAIRLLRKNTHYQFYDNIREKVINISYGEVVQYPPPKNEHFFKIFWRCLSTRFFKPVEDFDIEVLKYCQLLVNTPIKEVSLPYYDGQAYLAVINTLKKPKDSQTQELMNYNNLVHYIYLQFMCLNFKPSDKKSQNRLKNLRKEKHGWIPNLKLKQKEDCQEELRLELVNVKKLIRQFPVDLSRQKDDQISRQIQYLEAELEKINEYNKLEVNKLFTKANDEMRMRSFIYIVNTQKDKWQSEMNRKTELNERQIYTMQTPTRVSLVRRYLQYQILLLQHRQVAQSIAKVYPKNKAGEIYDIVFEKGAGLIPATFDVHEFRALQRLRQFSMIKYYQTSMKTKYYSMTNLIYGFHMLFKRKFVENKKGKDLIHNSKWSRQFKLLGPVTEDTLKSFQTFDTCHHCKQLYDPLYLVKCTYNSSTMGPPSHSMSFIDPYVQQIIQREGHIPGRNYLNNQKNPYVGYHKKGTDSVCYRKYCKFCWKNSYDFCDKSGICPFCQGVCFCSRCLRNDTIVKLKTLYALMGGDVRSLNAKSILYKLSQNVINDNAIVEQPDLISSNKSPVEQSKIGKSKSKGKGKGRGRGRWAAKQLQKQAEQDQVALKINSKLEYPKVTLRQFVKLQQIREEIEQCRQLCHMVKRREKQKLLIVQNKHDLFYHLTNDLDNDFKIIKRPRSGDDPAEFDENKRVTKKKALK